MNRAKIAVLYVGGSIGMTVNKATGRIEPIESIDEIYKFLPELQKEVRLDFFPITTVGSSDITPDHWCELSTVINKQYEKYDGFVVIHGTNTMTYTAAALSFSLQGLSKPIICTGALMPLNDLAGDGRMNLIHAIRAAQLDIAEVCIVSGARVLRAVRTKKMEQALFNTFDSPGFPPLANFNVQVDQHPWRKVRRKRTLECKAEFETNIAVLTLFPGIHLSVLDSILARNHKAIVLQAYGPGMLPSALEPWLEKVANAKVPLLLVSQTVCGRIELDQYRKQLLLQHLGFIAAKNMTLDCAVTKLMWSLAQGKTGNQLKKYMEQSIVGELDE